MLSIGEGKNWEKNSWISPSRLFSVCRTNDDLLLNTHFSHIWLGYKKLLFVSLLSKNPLFLQSGTGWDISEQSWALQAWVGIMQLSEAEMFKTCKHSSSPPQPALPTPCPARHLEIVWNISWNSSGRAYYQQRCPLQGHFLQLTRFLMIYLWPALFVSAWRRESPDPAITVGEIKQRYPPVILPRDLCQVGSPSTAWP